MSFYSWLLGRPFVYDYVRPLAVGGVDVGLVFRKLGAGDRDVVLDVGCGTGAALRHLRGFASYVGVDPDPDAVAVARARFGDRRGVTFQVGLVDDALIGAVDPTRAVLAGVLHHLTDGQSTRLLSCLRGAGRLARVVTLDIVCLEGERVSNVLAALDRGRYCRRREGYEQLARGAGWSVVESAVLRCHPERGRALYLAMTLERREP